MLGSIVAIVMYGGIMALLGVVIYIAVKKGVKDAIRESKEDK